MTSKELKERAFRIRNRANAPQDQFEIETAELIERAAKGIVNRNRIIGLAVGIALVDGLFHTLNIIGAF